MVSVLLFLLRVKLLKQQVLILISVEDGFCALQAGEKVTPVVS